MKAGDPQESTRPAPLASDRKLARTTLAIFILAAGVAVVGPLISYQSDVSELRSLLRARLSRDGRVYAEALSRHLLLLQQDLERLATRPELDPRLGGATTEQVLSDFAQHHGILFGSGIVLFDQEGRVAWADASSDRRRLTESTSGWFQRLLALRAPVVDVLGEPHAFLVAVPVLRGGQPVGALAGILEPGTSPLPSGPGPGGVMLAVIDGAGDILLPHDPPAFMKSPRFLSRVDELVRDEITGPLGLLDPAQFASATPVGSTGLRLVLLGDEDALLLPMRGRFLLQLLLVAAVQIGAVIFLSLFLQRTYARMLAIERRGVEQEKLAALGAAASLIAHEVKNALNGLNAAASMLASGPENGLPVRTIRGQTDRLKHLASSLLHFGKPASPQLSRLALSGLVRETVEGLRILPEADEVSLEFTMESDGEILAPCDPLLLATAVDNLVRNGVEAAVSAKDLGKVKEPRVTVRVSRDGAVAVISVEDNAGGVPPDFAQRLFEPFATSKPKGIGLGLSMARRAMEQQGGSLGFERTELGSRFTIRLPLERAS